MSEENQTPDTEETTTETPAVETTTPAKEDGKDPFKRDTPAAKKAAKKKSARKSKLKLEELNVVLLDKNGAESDTEFEVVKVTSSAIIVKEIVPDNKRIKVGGVEIEVDLNKLKRMNPNDTQHGVRVSLLLAAAEIA